MKFQNKVDEKNLRILLDKLIEEHKKEIEGSEGYSQKLQKQTSQLEGGKAINPVKGIEKAGQLGILKDKIIFHKACIAQLKAVLEEISS